MPLIMASSVSVSFLDDSPTGPKVTTVLGCREPCKGLKALVACDFGTYKLEGDVWLEEDISGPQLLFFLSLDWPLPIW